MACRPRSIHFLVRGLSFVGHVFVLWLVCHPCVCPSVSLLVSVCLCLRACLVCLFLRSCACCLPGNLSAFPPEFLPALQRPSQRVHFHSQYRVCRMYTRSQQTHIASIPRSARPPRGTHRSAHKTTAKCVSRTEKNFSHGCAACLQHSAPF